MYKFSLIVVAVVLSAGVVAAQAAPPLVNPVTVNIGTPVHLTPIDQNGAPIPIGQCTLVNVPVSIATFAKDATGIVINAIAPGIAALARLSCTDGTTTVLSATFSVTIPAPPYAVTAVGDTMP